MFSPLPFDLISHKEADNGHLEPSLKILETAATRLDTFERSGSNTDKSKLPTITTEYYTLRIYLARTATLIIIQQDWQLGLVMASRKTRYRRALIFQAEQYPRLPGPAKYKYGGLLHHRNISPFEESIRHSSLLAGKGIRVKLVPRSGYWTTGPCHERYETTNFTCVW